MRIGLISHELTYSGGPRSMLNMSKAFRKLGHDVKVYSVKDGAFRTEYINNGFNIDILDDIIDDDLDIILGNTVFSIDALEKYVRGTVKKILVIREAHNLDEIIQNIGITYERLNVADEIWCVSEYAYQFLMSKYKYKNIKVLHNYVENMGWPGLNVLHERKIRFAVLGTVEKRKQQNEIINAFNKLPDFLRNKAELYVVGRRPKWSEDYWGEFWNKKYKNVFFYDEICDQEELKRFYKRMNVLIIGSLDEACSLVALEAASYGKALILSENVGAKYILDSPKYVFKTGDEDDLCKKMSLLTSRRELLINGIKNRVNYLRTSTEKIYIKEIGEKIR